MVAKEGVKECFRTKEGVKIFFSLSLLIFFSTKEDAVTLSWHKGENVEKHLTQRKVLMLFFISNKRGV